MNLYNLIFSIIGSYLWVVSPNFEPSDKNYSNLERTISKSPFANKVDPLELQSIYKNLLTAFKSDAANEKLKIKNLLSEYRLSPLLAEEIYRTIREAVSLNKKNNNTEPETLILISKALDLKFHNTKTG